ncbi:helix-turn-helix transcriptional regulator [Erythrobacter cryptus]|uniref:helix-turn-helix transcriptional regulator n=1 Tax=Erythrobacter cryptus TaxID=196588 RepID=UPI0004292B6C|nr:WYL domain-containing protein [Erythrobacter cryptus]
MARNAKLDRLLTLVKALSESAEGLTLDDMAAVIGANRRTAERLRDLILVHFDLEETIDDRHKRFRIPDALPSAFIQPTAAEIAALQALAEAARRSASAQAPLLESLAAKVQAGLRREVKSRMAPDLEPLVRLQRHHVPAGPMIEHAPETVAQVQGAMMAGMCLEFDYLAEGARAPGWRRVIPLGLIHGPATYLIGKIPGRDLEPVPYRLDRMSAVRVSNHPGAPAEDWDLDAWMHASFGIWREEGHEIVLRVSAEGAARARRWRFHPQQVIEEDGEELVVRFFSGGLREIAEHLFTWGGTVRIEGPEELRAMMRERLALVTRSVEE